MRILRFAARNATPSPCYDENVTPDMNTNEVEFPAKQWAEAHVRFTSQIHGKRGITWTAHIVRDSLMFERSAFGEVRYGARLRSRAAAEAVEDYVQYVRTHADTQ